jgi:hypothetical protein
MNFKMMSSLAVAPLAVAGVMGSMDSASAAGLVGRMSITGNANVRIGTNSFSFLPSSPAPYTVTPGTPTGGTSGSFNTFVGTNSGGNDKGGFIYSVSPTGPVVPIPTLVSNANRLLDLGNLDGSKTFHLFTISDVSFTQVGGSVIAGLAITGVFRDASGVLTEAIGSFTTQFDGTTIAALEAQIDNNGFIENSFSGSTLAVESVPEPFTMAGSALALGAMGYFKRKQSAKKAAGVA